MTTEGQKKLHRLKEVERVREAPQRLQQQKQQLVMMMMMMPMPIREGDARWLSVGRREWLPPQVHKSTVLLPRPDRTSSVARVATSRTADLFVCSAANQPNHSLAVAKRPAAIGLTVSVADETANAFPRSTRRGPRLRRA